MEDDQTDDESSYSISSPGHPGGYQFLGLRGNQIPGRESGGTVSAVTILSILAFIEMFDVALSSYFLTSASESKLNDPDEVHESLWGLKVGRALGPNGISNRA
jgi:hypothetical protein